MTHNDYEIYNDLVKPISKFFYESKIISSQAKSKTVRQVDWKLKLPP